MKRIPLTQGQFALVDDADFDWLSQWKWHTVGGGKHKHYASRTIYVNGGKGKRDKCVSMHRLIFDFPARLEVDHINGNGLDNQRINLRICTKEENRCNRQMQRKNLGKYKGVTWDKTHNKWRAMIRFNTKLIHLGRFDNEKLAANTYNAAAVKYHGRFAKLNAIHTTL